MASGPTSIIQDEAAHSLTNGINGNAGDQFEFSIIQSEQDKEDVVDFMQKHFRVQEPITRALSKDFDSGHSLIARHKGTSRLAGIILNAFYDQLPPSADATFEEKIQKEFYKEITEGQYPTVNANRLLTLIDLAERGVDKVIPPNEKVFKIDVLGVHPDFAGKGLGSILVNRSLQLSRSLGCEYAYTCASAKASAHIFKKFGFRSVRTIPYDEFLENGQPVYRNLHDGGTGISLMVLKL
ncbi:acetyltransferase (GNAT) family domain-containing protein [Ditylenchus destructor]|uniref:Acetyltransferase (GNAT) family domain-containing protein n=1 Tax=Ditylenchus destructor TaxID=166010 RepID=A0AAD4RAE2_9BILA|nr:acetyltransferase (GNAT) family domain-containing protein [Ditylenchus destructor]